MVRSTHLLAVGSALWLAACADTTGLMKPGLPASSDRQLHQLEWMPNLGRQFALQRPSDEHGISAVSPVAPPALSSYSVSFWTFAGQDRSIEIDYRDANASWQPYLVLSVPQGSLLSRPDGTPFAPTDSILITISIDTTKLLARLEPTGLTFTDATPAQLKIWYTGASSDFDGNGVIDSADDYIEESLLGVWVQEHPDDPWAPVQGSKFPSSRLLVANLKHFSGYTISW
jgi:hypothetical protein